MIPFNSINHVLEKKKAPPIMLLIKFNSLVGERRETLFFTLKLTGICIFPKQISPMYLHYNYVQM